MWNKKRLLMTTLVATLALIATPAMAQNPYAEPNNSWISLSGTVRSVGPDTFVLDYGEGLVTVAMDDWDNDADAYKVVEGDNVTVTGKVDDDLFETTSIEASAVYVEGLNTYFYADAADEEDTFVTLSTPILIASTTLQGTVTDVRDEEFTLDTGLREMTVTVEEMPYDPLDDEGFQKIEPGDRVSVSGEIDNGFFEGRELVADTIVTLEDRS